MQANTYFGFGTSLIVTCMLIETFTVGMLYTNCYVASCQQTKETIVIDPGLDFSSETQPIFKYIDQAKLRVMFIVNTHGHPDHVKADAIFQERYNAPICIHTLDAHFIGESQKGESATNVMLEEGSLIKFGCATLRAMHTPGHTPGSICLIGEKLIFTGDTLFAGSIGRTDFEGGSLTDMQHSLQKLTGVPDYFLVYPGHGETSFIGQEKRFNPFLNDKSKDLMF